MQYDRHLQRVPTRQEYITSNPLCTVELSTQQFAGKNEPCRPCHLNIPFTYPSASERTLVVANVLLRPFFTRHRKHPSSANVIEQYFEGAVRHSKYTSPSVSTQTSPARASFGTSPANREAAAMDFLLTAFAPYPSQSSPYSCGNKRSFARSAFSDIFCPRPLDFSSSSTGIITIWKECPPKPRGTRKEIRFALGFAISNQISEARLAPEITFIQSVFSITIGILTVFLSTGCVLCEHYTKTRHTAQSRSRASALQQSIRQFGRTSLDKLFSDDSIPYVCKLTGSNVGVNGNKVTLPHHMAMFIRQATF